MARVRIRESAVLLRGSAVGRRVLSGEVIEVDDQLRDSLVSRGLAEVVTEKVAKEAAPPKTEAPVEVAAKPKPEVEELPMTPKPWGGPKRKQPRKR